MIPLKETVDRAVKGLDFVRSVFVMSRTGARVPLTSRDIPLEEVRKMGVAEVGNT